MLCSERFSISCMRILLDECVPGRLARDLGPHDVTTVRSMGWSGLPDGELLRRAERRFDVLLTVDRNLQYQQDISAFDVGLVVLAAGSNRLAALRPLVPDAVKAVRTIEPGTVVTVRHTAQRAPSAGRGNGG